MRIMSISEIFEFTSRIRTKQERIDFLRAHRSPLMEYLVKGAFHPDIKWLLPEGKAPYRPASDSDTHAIFYSEARKLRYFVEGVDPGVIALWEKPLSDKVRVKLFIQMLETIHPADAEVLLMVKDKKLDFPFLTYQLFQEAFPEWLPARSEGDSQEVINEKAEILIRASSPEFAKLTGEKAVEKALEEKPKYFQKGGPSYNKGKPMSPETIAKIRAKALERSRLKKEANASLHV